MLQTHVAGNREHINSSTATSPLSQQKKGKRGKREEEKGTREMAHGSAVLRRVAVHPTNPKEKLGARLQASTRKREEETIWKWKHAVLVLGIHLRNNSKARPNGGFVAAIRQCRNVLRQTKKVHRKSRKRSVAAQFRLFRANSQLSRNTDMWTDAYTPGTWLPGVSVWVRGCMCLCVWRRACVVWALCASLGDDLLLII